MGSQCVRDACGRAEDDSEITFPQKGGAGANGQSQAGAGGQPIQNNQWYSMSPPVVGVDVKDGKGGGPLKAPDVDSKGRRQGFGQIQEVGYRYDGNFRDDLKHGHGVLTWPDGREYRGQFVAGKFNGEATMVWSDGRRYEGGYVDGRKHGVGSFVWPDGRKYEGDWLDGKRHGRGTYTNTRGETRTGMWHNDKPVSWETNNSGGETSRTQYEN